jgi:adenylate kinase family enzyme
VKTVYLTSGPRGSGKSTFCKKVKALNPKLKVIIRDEILMELYGSTSLDPYSGGHYYAQEIIFNMIKKLLSAKGKTNIIFDFWNGFPGERIAMIKRLKELGADQVFCWQFQVAADTCVKWFFQKPDSKGYSKSGIRNDYALYYEMAGNIEQDGFDKVFHIDPLQPVKLQLITQ